MNEPTSARSITGGDYGRMKYYVLGLLALTYALSIVDRFLLGILLPQIKAELELSDSLLGLLSGAAFALFYATLGVPIARLADRIGRKYVISASLAIFSVMTAVCGAAVNFTTLLLARVGVGIGEAGTTPASLSIISDLFEKERRSLAMALFSVGGNVGMLAGFIIGGYVAVHYGWRQAFLIIGAPGIIVSLIILATLREPRRGLADGLVESDTAPRESLWSSARFLLSQPAYRNMVLGISMMLFVATGVIAWLPSYLARSHGMQADEVGRLLGLALGLAGPIGTVVLGGIVADRLSRRDMRWGMWLVGIVALLLCPAYLLVIVAPTGSLAITAYFVPAVFGIFFQGPTAALSQAVSPVSMRATSGALLLLVGNLIGLGLGPLAIGVLSDALEPRFGVESLRYALLLAPIAAVVGAALYFRAATTLRADIARAEGRN
jgi:predicted MFS family arabinose efflux permease